MKRSTNNAPVASSTSYLMGSAFIGISMMTLNCAGARAPGPTLCRLMWQLSTHRGDPDFTDAFGTAATEHLATSLRMRAEQSAPCPERARHCSPTGAHEIQQFANGK